MNPISIAAAADPDEWEKKDVLNPFCGVVGEAESMTSSA